MAEDPAGRFHLVEAPPLAPGNDYLTHSTVGPFVDTGVEMRWGERGRVYLSVDTIRELADVAGLFDTLVSIPSSDLLQDEYNRGYDDATKENLDGTLRSVAAELVAAADRLADAGNGILLAVAAELAPSDAPLASDLGTPESASAGEPDDDDDVIVKGTDEADHAGDDGADLAAAAAPSSRGKGNGTRRNRRPAGVSGGSGDGDNPFQI